MNWFKKAQEYEFSSPDVTPFWCGKCKEYKHSDEITENDGFGPSWQIRGEVYCGHCGGPIRHVYIDDDGNDVDQ